MEAPTAKPIMKTFAIVQTAFLGDIVIALGMARSLKKLFPTCSVTFVTTPAGAQFAKLVEEVDSIVEYDKRKEHRGARGIIAIAKTLKELKIDTLFAPHRSFRTSFMCALSGASRTIGFNTNSLSWLYDHQAKYQKDAPEYIRNSQLMQEVFADIQPVPATFSSARLQPLTDLVSATFQLPKEYVVVAPGSVWATKRYPVEQYRVVVHELLAKSVPVVVLGSDADQEVCEPLGPGVINLCGKTSLQEFAAIIAKAQVIVGNDSSPTHVANAANTPVVCIFGPTVPSFGFAPTGARDVVVEHKELSCRPCSPHGTASCPEQHFMCMREIPATTIVNAVMNILENEH